MFPPVCQHYDQTQGTRDKEEIFHVRFPFEAIAKFSKGTKVLQLYSHGLHGGRNRLHLLRIGNWHGSRSCVGIPIVPDGYKLNIHWYRPHCLAEGCFQSAILCSLVRHRQVSILRPPHSALLYRMLVVFHSSRCLGPKLFPNASCDLYALFRLLLTCILCALQQYIPHQIVRLPRVLLLAFFYDFLAKLNCHLFKHASIQIKFLCDLAIRQIRPCEVQTENLNTQRFVMSGKDSTGQSFKTFTVIFTFIALPGSFFFIKSSSHNVSGIVKGTLSSFEPAHFIHSIVALSVIHQILDIYFHRLDSFREVINGMVPSIITHLWIPT